MITAYANLPVHHQAHPHTEAQHHYHLHEHHHHSSRPRRSSRRESYYLIRRRHNTGHVRPSFDLIRTRNPNHVIPTSPPRRHAQPYPSAGPRPIPLGFDHTAAALPIDSRCPKLQYQPCVTPGLIQDLGPHHNIPDHHTSTIPPTLAAAAAAAATAASASSQARASATATAPHSQHQRTSVVLNVPHAQQRHGGHTYRGRCQYRTAAPDSDDEDSDSDSGDDDDNKLMEIRRRVARRILGRDGDGGDALDRYLDRRRYERAARESRKVGAAAAAAAAGAGRYEGGYGRPVYPVIVPERSLGGGRRRVAVPEYSDAEMEAERLRARLAGLRLESERSRRRW